MKLILRKTTLLLTSLACLTACIETYPSVEQMTGIIDETFTRTSFKKDGIKLNINWEYGDYIIVKGSEAKKGDIDDSGEYGTGEDESERGFSYITEYIEENKALFALVDDYEPKAPYTAFYPREISQYTLPDNQDYCENGPQKAPMMAKAPTKYLLFKPICGAIEIKLTTTLENAVVKKLVLSTDQPLCGTFTIDDSFVARAYGDHSLTLDCAGGVALGSEPKSFWFSVPQGEYSNVKVVLTTTDGRIQTFSLSDTAVIEVIRGEITTCPISLSLLDDNSKYETATLPTGLEFNRFLKKIANPEIPFDTIESMTSDNKIRQIDFVTASSSTEGENINTAGNAPIFASFDTSTGVMTVTTPAKELRMHRDGTCMFRYLTALRTVNLDALNTTDLANMTFMFNHCESIREIDIKAIKSTTVTDMDNCFSDCHNLESLDMGSFRTDRLTNFRSCFLRCYNLSGKLDLSGIRSDKVTLISYSFQECNKVTSIDMRNIIPNTVAENMKYLFFKVPCLEELFLNDKFFPTDNVSASNIFASSSETHSARTANKPGHLTIHCSQASADWFAITTLRWVNSGYRTNVKIPVTFIDNVTGKELTVKWAAN